jgi:hypothetical protein
MQKFEARETIQHNYRSWTLPGGTRAAHAFNSERKSVSPGALKPQAQRRLVMNRRKLLKLGGVAAALVTTKTVTQAEPQPSSRKINFTLSVTVERDGAELQDLGGLNFEDYPLEVLGSATCCSVPTTSVTGDNSTRLNWHSELPSYIGSGVGRAELGLNVNVSSDTSTFTIQQLTITNLDTQATEVTVNVDQAFPISAGTLISLDRSFGAVTYHFFGFVGEPAGLGNELQTSLRSEKRPGASPMLTPMLSIINIVDTGFVPIPFTNYEVRVHGPEKHPLRPCRSVDTWHMNVVVQQRSNHWEVSNNHYGAYRDNGRFCLIYFDNRRTLCWSNCTPYAPSFAQVRDYAQQMVDNSLRSVGIVLPYLALVTIASMLASAYFASLVVLI